MGSAFVKTLALQCPPENRLHGHGRRDGETESETEKSVGKITGRKSDGQKLRDKDCKNIKEWRGRQRGIFGKPGEAGGQGRGRRE